MGAGGGQWQSQHGEDVAHVPSDRLPAGSKPARPLTVVEQLPDGAEDLLGALPRFPYHLPDTGAGTANHCRGPRDHERRR